MRQCHGCKVSADLPGLVCSVRAQTNQAATLGGMTSCTAIVATPYFFPLFIKRKLIYGALVFICVRHLAEILTRYTAA
jgi:hypothetical protein